MTVTMTISRLDDDVWHTWKNADGQTASLRHHFKTKHYKVWREIVVMKQLKGWMQLGVTASEKPQGIHHPRAREPFSLAGFYERLIKWIAVDDQVG